MRKNFSTIIFISGAIMVVLSLLLIFIMNQAVTLAMNVLLPTGSFLLLLGSFLPNKKDNKHVN